ncbi:rho guanine nucleotide exchange factor 28 [Hyla sarda]|uniref:rho guanine nucleotide exchange factor 28 n=1 Tax=Hyla sarda TaxID=327740 RepID=UPI0024C25759|nr:rho guanine nucleotide exchange factor 28 [Hyla sarda]XP_056395883.1 rho guanine nucleotide exchange factor 28 [Hyla sarda]XP_056395884.1 rho guanine nucleotide exchange factor 28 [Hyla sarda]XP_056395890.1 rho guanine nucleotide exchange factor 28 [Hyla sarda]XP_056395899.1 rho guanine nucleotide exchange factor 28 [Hyla sarda]
MELSQTEVPLYGQMTVLAQFGEDFHLPEDAEFYFVYNGSSHRHVSFAERLSANSLQSIFPGHNCPESVSVTVCMHTHGYSPVIVSCASISYVRDKVCSISHSLKSHCDRLTSSSHETILEQFDVAPQDLQLLDRNMMLCLAHEDLTSSWNVLGSYSQSDNLCHETLLHLTMRWGLIELSHYLICLPGGPSALSRVNKEGETPVEVAIRHGHWKLVQHLKNFQDLPPLDFCTATINPDSFLRFCWSSGVLTLTRRQTSGHSLESDIDLFRKCLCDTIFFDKIVSPMHPWNYKKQRSLDGSAAGGEKRHSSVDVLKRIRYPPTMLAATRLSAMLNGSDEVYVNSMVIDEVNDSDVGFMHSDVSYNDQSDSTPTSESSLRDPNLSACATPEMVSEDSSAYSFPSRHSLPGGPNRLCRTLGYGTERDAAYSSVKKRSSSLDGLDADSEGEGTYSRYPDSPVKEDSSSYIGNSADELDSSETSAERDFQSRQAGTLPLLQSKDPLSSGLRFRSYSYSSPKNFLGKPRLTRDLSVGEPGDERAFSLPDQSREKRIEEEDWDRYMTPVKPECEKNKVSRTFSFLRSRMSSTRNKNKTKNKEAKEKVNRHQFVSGTFSGVVPCLVCEKALLGKESLQCSNCNVNVHKACKDATPACSKKFQDRYNPKYKQPAVISNTSFRDVPQPVLSTSPPSTSMTLGKRDCGHAASRGVPVSGIDRRLDQSLESDGDTSGSRSRSQSEELLQSMGTPPSMDTFPIEDAVDSALWSDLSSDTLEFEAESWSSVVDSSFCHKQEKNVIKRQDVIFELMQTELHHIQTLFIMSEIFRKGMKEELQLDHSTVDKIFPCLDELLEIHKSFFYSLRERKQESREGNDRNFVIHRIGDILVQQFSAENAEKMKMIYGEFCSHHIEAMNLFKELQQNKKFQNFLKMTNSNLQARRRGIPECILLVTQRITKYPVLVERILRYTPEGTEENKDLCRALSLIKDMVTAVDLKVSEFERKQKLEEFLNKIENKTFTKMKNGHVFTKQDLRIKERVLLHDGVLLWKTATGRFKDIQALLLSDVLLFLQEKDQKYIFAAVDQKPPIISLQKLIVRKVANEERGMFLISASSAGPEMYEIHTSSKDERNAWMRQIQEAVQRCPEEEEGKPCESDEDKRAAEARAAKAKEYQEILGCHDQQIFSCLEDKLQMFAELAAMCGGSDMHLEPHLLVKADSGEVPQAASLLAAALKEAESLYTTLTTELENSAWSAEDGETSGRNMGWSNTEPLEEGHEFQYPALPPDIGAEHSFNTEPSSPPVMSDMDMAFTEEKVELENSSGYRQAEIMQAVQNLTRLLYSIQAVVTLQDSQIELNKVLLQDQHEPASKGVPIRGALLQEHNRHLERHRGDLASLEKLQHQLHHEKNRWEREFNQKEQEYVEMENILQERQRMCQNQEHLLEEEREELSQKLQEYQQNVERLNEGQRIVEKKRQQLCLKDKLLSHTRQNSMPVLIPRPKTEGVRNSQHDSLQNEDSNYINNALAQMSLGSIASLPDSHPHVHNTLDLAETSESTPADISSEPWSSLISRQHRLENSSRHSNKDACNNDINAAHVIFCGTLLATPGHNMNTGSHQTAQTSETMKTLHTDPPSCVENGLVEETIVYL